jgi:endonuclease/exonuclease/phosphatase family metal-dependent hydrolase
MATTFRVGTFNFENLFQRPKVLNLRSNQDTREALDKIAQLQSLLAKTNYTPTVKTKILALYAELKPYIKIDEDRGKLFGGTAANPTIKASGKDAWDGSIELKIADISEMARENTAKVIKALNADVLCTVEVENRQALRAFDAQMLSSRFPYDLAIDGNDPRGIDVGLYSKFPIGAIYTHMFDKTANNRVIFSRDCLEVELTLPDGRPLYVLCNHFKSQGYGNAAENDAKRKLQSERVAEILSGYDLATDYVVVAGDLNDTDNRPPNYTLRPLLDVPNLFNVLAIQFPNDPVLRWTYHYQGQFNQIDYLLVSKPLREGLQSAKVERRGIYRLNALTNGDQQEFSSVTSWTNAASDHAALVAEFSV